MKERNAAQRLVNLLAARTRRPEIRFFDLSLDELDLAHPLA
jgi:hypothetical protein